MKSWSRQVSSMPRGSSQEGLSHVLRGLVVDVEVRRAGPDGRVLRNAVRWSIRSVSCEAVCADINGQSSVSNPSGLVHKTF
jgi:hypothetical protein